jgi:3-dehydroquinate dehydratase/shikimate dehydrogenase
MSELCITVIGRDAESIRRARIAAEAEADLVELRLDAMERPDAAAALDGRTRPAIATCRPLREGGMFDGPEEDRLRVLDEAHAHGAEFIDLEWDAVRAPVMAARRGRGVVVSRHVFDCTPRNAAQLLEHLRAQGGEIAKLAVMSERIGDLRALLDVARAGRGAGRGGGDSILIGMGSGGALTRILAGRFGSRWTYAGDRVAPGQLTASRLIDEFRFRRIRPDAAVYAVLGRPVAGSLSPAMHNAGFAALGLNAVYVPLETRDLDGLRAFAAEIGLRGLSVTIPFKQDVLTLVDEIAPEARAAGAVNTIAIGGGASAAPGAGRWIGSNTDADGFLEPLRARGVPLRGLRATILGAGGAARGVAFALAREGAAVAIAARRAEAAAAVAAAIAGTTAPWPPPRGSWDLLVNATPVGSRAAAGTPFEGPFDGGLVYDLVYDPDPTELMARAARAGVATVGGLAMLVAQAERPFETRPGQRPPAGLFVEAARAAARARHPNGLARAAERARDGAEGERAGGPATAP